MIDTQEFRNGMAMLSGAVNVITTGGSEGLAGFTATAVCSVTDQPPMLLVCMNRSSYAHRFFTANGVRCVNLLGGDQQGLSGLFADREVSMEQRFQRAAWRALETGSPALDDALVSFDCRISQIHEVGSHSIFYCEVVQMRQGDPRPGLVYFNRNYHRVGEELRQAG